MGDRQLKLGIAPPQNLLQVQVRAQAELVAVARGAVVVITAMQVGAYLAHVIEGEGVAFLLQLATGAIPVTEHPFGIAVESRGRVDAGGQPQSGESAHQVHGFLPGNRKQRTVFAQNLKFGHKLR